MNVINENFDTVRYVFFYFAMVKIENMRVKRDDNLIEMSRVADTYKMRT